MSLDPDNKDWIKEKILYYSSLFSDCFGYCCMPEASCANALEEYKKDFYYHLYCDLSLAVSVNISIKDIETMVHGTVPFTMKLSDFYDIYSYIEASRLFIDTISTFKITSEYFLYLHRVLCKYSNCMPKGYRNKKTSKSSQLLSPPHYVVKDVLYLVFFRMEYIINHPLEFFFRNIILLLWLQPFNDNNMRTSILFTRLLLLSKGYNIYISEELIKNISYYREYLKSYDFEGLCIAFKKQLNKY